MLPIAGNVVSDHALIALAGIHYVSAVPTADFSRGSGWQTPGMPPSTRSTVRRLADYARYDREPIEAILASGRSWEGGNVEAPSMLRTASGGYPNGRLLHLARLGADASGTPVVLPR